MKSNICFISNFSKTEFFEKVADTLGSEVKVYWIAVNNRIYEKLKEKYGCDKVLLINKGSISSRGQVIGDYKLNELIYGDRLLVENSKTGLQYLQSIQKPIFSFLKDNSISFVLGEMTWSHELLIHRIINDKLKGKCIFLNPHTVRIPNGRFAFFYDEFQSKFYSPKKKLDTNQKFEIQKPDYLSKNDELRKERGSLIGLMKRGGGFLMNKHYEPNDPTRMNRRQTLSVFIKEFYNKKYYQLFIKRQNDLASGKKFVLFTLHKQPEASIDVLGRYYEDQLSMIKNIWRLLPNDYSLLVKEHTNALGDRNPDFYKEVLKLNNVVLVDEKADSKLLMQNSEAVFTISGTIAYEATLAGKFAFTFADCFFNGFGRCFKISMNDLRYSNNYFDFLGKLEDQNNSVENLKDYVLLNSFEGQIGDPVFNVQGMEKTNIEKVSLALKSVIIS